jgi:hypothetical protein
MIGDMKLRQIRDHRRTTVARRRHESQKDAEREPDAQETIWRRAKNMFVSFFGFSGGA